MRGRLMVGQQILDLPIQVRVLASQHQKQKHPLGMFLLGIFVNSNTLKVYKINRFTKKAKKGVRNLFSPGGSSKGCVKAVFNRLFFIVRQSFLGKLAKF